MTANSVLPGVTRTQQWLATLVGLALLLAAAVAGLAPAAARNSVGASTPTKINTVEVSTGITADQRLGKTVPQPQIVVATGVAADTAADLGKAEQYVYRIHGGDAGPMGHSWTPENPMGMSNPRDYLGLPKANSGQMLTRARVLNTDGVATRDALPIPEDGVTGGGPEWLFPDPAGQLEVHWTIPLVPPW